MNFQDVKAWDASLRSFSSAAVAEVTTYVDYGIIV
jgi:hypothetical protein